MLRKQSLPKKSVNTNEWLNTYADSVTLLLCFFVLLFSFSTLNETKWKKLVQAFNYKDINVEEIVSDIPDLKPQPTEEELLYERIKDYITSNNLDSKIDAIRDDGKITVRFTDVILFDPDRTELRSDGKIVLGDICKILNNSIDLIEMIQIQGHTAANPKGLPQFTRTFEFSTYRSINVLRYVLDVEKMDPYKLSIVGFGQYHPVGDNETEEGQVKNRRVELVVTSKESSRIPKSAAADQGSVVSN